MTAFDKAWKVAKYSDDGGFHGLIEVCSGCDKHTQLAYECGGCGRTFCETCLMDDQYGHPGHRGEIDSGNFITHFDGPHCGECVSEIIEEGSHEETWNE